MRERMAVVLCVASSGVATVLGIAAGLGFFILCVVLMANGTVGVGAGLALMLVGGLIVEVALYLVALAIGMLLFGLAHLADRDVAAAWADRGGSTW
jgi:hypothetical protein